MRFLVELLLRAYRLLVSPVLHFLAGPMGGCRFTPTCSRYASESLATHGLLRGGWLTTRRLCRCHPWGGCGHDPVPPATSATPARAGVTATSLSH